MTFHYLKTSLIFLLSITIIYILINSFNQEGRELWLKEHGIIENLSVIGYIVCITLMIYWGKWEYVGKYHYLIIIMIFFIVRELGLDKVSEFDVFHPQLYLSVAIPYREKILGAIIAVPTSYSIIIVLKNHLHPRYVIRNIKNLSPYHFYIFLAVLCIIFSQSFDLKDKISGYFGFPLNENITLKLFILEELLELAMPILFILATYHYFFSKKLH